jgi:hypothetical protein
MATPTIEQSRFIVFILDSKYKDHSGSVFCSLKDAKEYAKEYISEEFGDKAVIGMFVWDRNAREVGISHVESIGFKGDKKDVNQLELFNY